MFITTKGMGRVPKKRYWLQEKEKEKRKDEGVERVPGG